MIVVVGVVVVVVLMRSFRVMIDIRLNQYYSHNTHNILSHYYHIGQELRTEGINRLGNLLVPNDNYCLFEDWITPILNQMVDEQDSNPGMQWTPSEFIKRLGKEINHPDSVYYWVRVLPEKVNK